MSELCPTCHRPLKGRKGRVPAERIAEAVRALYRTDPRPQEAPAIAKFLGLTATYIRVRIRELGEIPGCRRVVFRRAATTGHWKNYVTAWEPADV